MAQPFDEKSMNLPNDVTLENCACPLGCTPNDELILRGRDRLADLPGEFSVVKCRTCDLMRTNPRPTADTIGFYYPDDYRPYQITQTGTGQNNVYRRLANYLRKLLSTRAQALPAGSSGHLLEIGCASGRFLHEMAEQGWQVEGIEFSPSAADAARQLGYSVQTGQVETAQEYEQKFDLIVAWMVLEHLHAPVQTLEKLTDWIKPDGVLAFSVPNAGSIECRIFGEDWYALQLPGHLTHFTPESLTRVLAASGWRVERIVHQRNITNLLQSWRLRCERRNKLSWMSKMTRCLVTFQAPINILFYPVTIILAAFGQTGRMTVWAKKV